MLATLVFGLPTASYSAPGEAKPLTLTEGTNDPQISVRIGQPRRRRWNRRNGRWNRFPPVRYRRDRGYRLVPQYYWMDGRRYVRYVRVYY